MLAQRVRQLFNGGLTTADQYVGNGNETVPTHIMMVLVVACFGNGKQHGFQRNRVDPDRTNAWVDLAAYILALTLTLEFVAVAGRSMIRPELAAGVH